MKIIDLINNNPDELQISMEFFPPKTPQGVRNLKTRVEKMVAEHQPIFMDITWGAGGNAETNQTTRTLALDWHQEHSSTAQVNMHLTCTNIRMREVREVLDELKESGIQNMVALRGDPPRNPITSGTNPALLHFKCALDLIKYIRQVYDDYFCITVSGYPEGHQDLFERVKNPEQLSQAERDRMVTYDNQNYVCTDVKYEESLQYLKRKADLADVIITQLFFDCDLFLKFVKDCRRVGIICPILPGIMLIQSYVGFQKMTYFCKTKVPTPVKQKLETIKDDASAVEAYGIQLAQEMCQYLVEHEVSNLHFYTLNKYKSVDAVIKRLKED